jgi:hypothetical protein
MVSLCNEALAKIDTLESKLMEYDFYGHSEIDIAVCNNFSMPMEG